MTITTPMNERLRSAASYMEQHGWTQGTEKDAAGRVCLTGAIRYCAPVDGDVFLIREVLRKKNHAETWNDKKGRNYEDVQKYLSSLDISDSDLEEAFGPQWEQLVALVRSCAALTRDQVIDLAAARAAARDAAWAAAGAAAWDAARDAAGAAARAAARDAAWAAAGAAARAAAWAAAGAAAWAAAWAAAGALVVRDLIGQHGFTQEHYNRLTGPWRAVIGRVHPDDA